MTLWTALKQVGKGLVLGFFVLGAMPILLIQLLSEIVSDMFL